MNIIPIKSEADYKLALKRLEKVFDPPVGTSEGDEADILGLLIDEYEKKHYPIEAPDPIEAIKIRMEELQLKQIDLVGLQIKQLVSFIISFLYNSRIFQKISLNFILRTWRLRQSNLPAEDSVLQVGRNLLTGSRVFDK